MRGVVALAAVAAALWLVLFSPWTAGALNFWLAMALAAGALAGAALYLARRDLGRLFEFRAVYVWIGLASAVVLYLVFFVGAYVSTNLLTFAAPQITDVYSTRAQAAPWVIALLLLVWVGPAEEIFWRGFLQDRVAARYGEATGYVAASLIYAGVHIWAFNLVLLGAALICGAFWGAMYWKYRSVWPGLISHAVWDVLIFVLFPLR